jgi:hypothetical protein
MKRDKKIKTNLIKSRVTGLALTSFSSKDFDRAGVRDSRHFML